MVEQSSKQWLDPEFALWRKNMLQLKLSYGDAILYEFRVKNS